MFTTVQSLPHFGQRSTPVKGTSIIHPPQVDRLTLRFGASIPPGFTPEAMTCIQSAVSQSHYRKDIEGLLSPERGFRVFHYQGKTILKNFQEPFQAQPPFHGICEDLTHSVGLYLQNQLGPDYVVQAAAGPVDPYFSSNRGGTHLFLLIWPQSENAKITQELDRPGVAEKPLPSGCLLVDPSFGNVLSLDQPEKLKNYHIVETYTPDEIFPHGTPYFEHPPEKPVNHKPLGFVKDVAPELAPQYGKEALLWLVFINIDSEIDKISTVTFHIQETPESTPKAINYSEILNNPMLKQLFDKLYQEMQQSESQNVKEIGEYLGFLSGVAINQLNSGPQYLKHSDFFLPRVTRLPGG